MSVAHALLQVPPLVWVVRRYLRWQILRERRRLEWALDALVEVGQVVNLAPPPDVAELWISLQPAWTHRASQQRIGVWQRYRAALQDAGEDLRPGGPPGHLLPPGQRGREQRLRAAGHLQLHAEHWSAGDLRQRGGYRRPAVHRGATALGEQLLGGPTAWPACAGDAPLRRAAVAPVPCPAAGSCTWPAAPAAHSRTHIVSALVRPSSMSPQRRTRPSAVDARRRRALFSMRYRSTVLCVHHTTVPAVCLKYSAGGEYRHAVSDVGG
jgi:hypothetical protein